MHKLCTTCDMKEENVTEQVSFEKKVQTQVHVVQSYVAPCVK